MNSISNKGTHIIAIDGPSGVGKTTVAARVAEQTGLPLLAGGRLFRAIAWIAEQEGVTKDAAIIKLAQSASLSFTNDGGIAYHGDDITNKLYSDAVSLRSSQIAQLPDLRQPLDKLMRDFGYATGCVTEGRSTGVHVFPDASLKIWLTADYTTRFRRIADSRGTEAAKQTMSRDTMDERRQHAPMTKASDAIEIDSTAMSVDEVVRRIVELYRQKIETL